MKKPFVHVSNDFKRLRDLLCEQLFFATSQTFEKQLILLPDMKWKNELMRHFISHPKLDVALGLDFMQLGSGLQFLFKSLTGKSLLFPPLDLLALHLQSILPEHAKKSKPLSAYLDDHAGKTESLAAHLSKAFLIYGKYDLTEWKKKDGWQQELWNDLFEKWDVPTELLETTLKKPEEKIDIHLFKFSYLPPVYHHFFEKVSEHWNVHYYQFSPCAEFWTDIFSERERLYVEGKTDPKKRNELSSYLKDRPSLLANLGGVARKTFRFFEENDFLLNETYQSPPQDTHLHRLQGEILHFKPNQSLQDQSMRLHPANSKRREVEILYETLLSLMQKEGYHPSDIRIYAPDIGAYAPYISFIFGSEKSPLPFTIFDLPKQDQTPLLQAFFELLSLPEKRFERVATLKLFSYQAVQKKLGIKEKDVDRFTDWMERGAVKWGIDSQHRKELLQSSDVHEKGEGGTWENAFRRTLCSFAQVPKERPIWNESLLDYSDAELFGKGVEAIRNLKKDLSFLDTASMTLFEWSRYLRDLIARTFQVDEDEVAALRFMEEKISLLETLGTHLPETCFPFTPIYRYLQNTLQDRSGVLAASEIEALQFSSLKLAAPDHAKVICVLGMDENQYPRISSTSSLSEIGDEPLAQEEDRHLLLELLFAARSHLIISYVNISEEDGKEQGPSHLIEELSLKPTLHPPFPFHHHYFEKNEVGMPEHHMAAKRFYKPENLPTPFIPEYLTPTELPQSEKGPLNTELNHLSRFAKHPIRYYFNQTLHLYLKYEADDEEFSFSPLGKMLLRQHALTSTLDHAFEEADLRGKLPLGRFKDLARLAADDEMAALQESLQTFGVQNEKPAPLDINLTLKLPKERIANLKGTVPDIVSEGLLYHGEKKISDLLKIWPLFLSFACSTSTAKKQILLTKTGERLSFPHLNPEDALASYLLYYEKGIQSPSPCLPLWGESFLKKDAEHLQKNIQKNTDAYTLHLFSKQANYSAETIHTTWTPLLQTTFKPLVEGLA